MLGTHSRRYTIRRDLNRCRRLTGTALCPSGGVCKVRHFGDAGVLEGNDLPLAAFPNCHYRWPGFNLPWLTFGIKLKARLEAYDRDVGTYEPDSHNRVVVAAALIDCVKDLLVCCRDGPSAHELAAIDVNKGGVVQEMRGEPSAISGIPCGYQLLHHCAECLFVCAHLFHPPLFYLASRCPRNRDRPSWNV